MSLSEDDKRSVDLEKVGEQHRGAADVRSIFPSPSIALLTVFQAVPVEEFIFDPNYDPSAAALEDESPYPEVRSAVANTDDPSMPVSTFRAWVFGLIWAIIIPGVNQFFFFRYPAVNITQVSRRLIFLSTIRAHTTCASDRAPAAHFPSVQALGPLYPQLDRLRRIDQRRPLHH